MKFTIDQLRTFVAVSETGSFSGAARRLHKTQPAVSAAIFKLETDLGVELFLRNGYKPELTDAGKHVLLETEALLMRCRSLEERAHAFAESTETRLVLAMDDAIPLATFREPFIDWEKVYPAVELQVTHPPMEAVSRLLTSNTVDLAVMFAQPDYPKELAFRRLGLLEMVEVAHHSHPLATMQEITFEDLSEYRQLIFAPHGKAIATSEYLISPRRYTTESYLSLLDMVRQGMGWSVVPYRLVSKELQHDELRKLDMAAYPFSPWLIGIDLLWSRKHKPGRAGIALRDRLAATVVRDDNKESPLVASLGQQ